MTALYHRPEFESIDWHVKDAGNLARQLWAFQEGESDRHYHKQLSARLGSAMELYGVDKTIIEQVQQITKEWIKRRGRNRCKEVLASREETREEKEAKLDKKKQINEERRKDRRLGFSKPLLDYMSIEKNIEATPKELHEEALRHRCMYRGARSFARNLRFMFRALGYKDEDVITEIRDPRNHTFESWSKIRQDPFPKDKARQTDTQEPQHPFHGDKASGISSFGSNDAHKADHVWVHAGLEQYTDGFEDLDLSCFDSEPFVEPIQTDWSVSESEQSSQCNSSGDHQSTQSQSQSQDDELFPA